MGFGLLNVFSGNELAKYDVVVRLGMDVLPEAEITSLEPERGGSNDIMPTGKSFAYVVEDGEGRIVAIGADTLQAYAGDNLIELSEFVGYQAAYLAEVGNFLVGYPNHPRVLDVVDDLDNPEISLENLDRALEVIVDIRDQLNGQAGWDKQQESHAAGDLVNRAEFIRMLTGQPERLLALFNDGEVAGKMSQDQQASVRASLEGSSAFTAQASANALSQSQ